MLLSGPVAKFPALLCRLCFVTSAIMYARTFFFFVGGDGACPFVACLSQLTIYHSSLSRRSALGGRGGGKEDVLGAC